MEQYAKVKKCFEENGCILHTPFEEFEEKRRTVLKQYYHYVRVNFTGTCGHQSSVVFTNFNLRKTGMVCRECVRSNHKEQIKVCKNTNETENDGIKIIEEYLSDMYKIVRTKEGCLADVAIQLKTTETDEWIPIQVKTTAKISHNMYSFTFNCKEYTNMLIFCVCVSEQKIWVVPFNNLKIKYKLNISIKSKYNKYFVDNTHLHTVIQSHLNQIYKSQLDLLNTPITTLQQREQEYVKKRELYVPFLQYIYPDIQGTVVDVICNSKKVQEKVLGFIEKINSFHALFCSNNGLIKGKRHYRTYMLGENDYYWLHSQIDDRFWIIPETVLHEHGYIADVNQKINKKVLKFKTVQNNNNQWLDAFVYHYNAVDKEKIMRVFE